MARVYRQGDDGVWRLVGKTISASTKDDMKNSDAIYTYWTTGWAAIGLLATLPAQDASAQ